MKIFDVYESDIHGGSFRVFFCKNDTYDTTENIENMLLEERELAFLISKHLINLL